VPTIEKDPNASPPADHVAERCCDAQGSCVQKNQLAQADRARLPRDVCSDVELVCLPDVLSAGADSSENAPALSRCQAFGLAEGRCLPACLLAESTTKAWFSQQTCANSQLCAPCYDPLTSAFTGACPRAPELDAGAPFVFASCCKVGEQMLGRCIPRPLAGSASSQLRKLECSGADDICVPSSLLGNVGGWFPGCEVQSGVAGACLPECMVSPSLGALPRNACAEGERCVPCKVGNQVTGACAGS
jgi:hypothetical protein